MADKSVKPEKRPLDESGETTEEKKTNNETEGTGISGNNDIVVVEQPKTEPKTNEDSAKPSDRKTPASSIGSGFMGYFRRAFSSGPARNKEFWLKLSLEEKRSHYKCGKDYFTLKNIPTWPEFVRNKHIESTDTPPKYSFNQTLNEKVSLFQGDITRLEIDGIVNAANSSLMGGGGVDGAIHSAAGYSLRDECALLNGCDTGQTKISTGHRLPAKHILHTVGPINGSEKLLKSCYTTCYDLVEEHNLQSVAFCCVATGVYGFPNEEAAHIALNTTRKWLEENHSKVNRVIFVVFLKTDLGIYTRLMQTYFPLVDKCIDDSTTGATPTTNTDTPTAIPDTPTANPDTPPSVDNEAVTIPNLTKSVTAPPLLTKPENDESIDKGDRDEDRSIEKGERKEDGKEEKGEEPMEEESKPCTEEDKPESETEKEDVNNTHNAELNADEVIPMVITPEGGNEPTEPPVESTSSTTDTPTN